MSCFVRFQSAVPNRHGRHPGFFALANGLAWAGALSPADHAWWAAANAEADALHRDPSTVDPACYDRTLNAGAVSWFKETARPLLALAADYLLLLDRHSVPWVELRTASPGRVVYDDDVQVVAVPYTYEGDWRLPVAPPGQRRPS